MDGFQTFHLPYPPVGSSPMAGPGLPLASVDPWLVANEAARSMIMDLPDEMLLMIINELETVEFCWRRARHGPLSSRQYWVTSLKELSLVNKRMRALTISTLFKYAQMHDDFMSLPLGCPHAPLIDKLGMLARQPAILASIQYFIVAPTAPDWVLASKRGLGAPVPTSYHYNTPHALWQCLAMMPNLKEISLRLRGPATLTPLLESHLANNAGLPLLAKVRGLSIYSRPSQEMAMFVRMTPNVVMASIEVPDCMVHCPLLRAFARLPTLKYLMLCRVVPRPRQGTKPIGWGVKDIPAIAQIVPNIKHLALVGQLDTQRQDGVRLSRYIPHFERFTSLEQLDMTDEFVVDGESVQYAVDTEDPMDDEEGFREAVADEQADTHPWNESRVQIARTFFRTIPTLQKLYLTRVHEGRLFERAHVHGQVRSVESVRAGDRHDFAGGFPRVLEVNDIPCPAPVD